MRALLVFALFFALNACDTPLGTEIARDQAKGVVNEIVRKRAPGVDARPVTDCIIDNASGSEIVSIASDSLAGTPSEKTVKLVIDIAKRPDTVECLVTNVGPLVVARLAAGA